MTAANLSAAVSGYDRLVSIYDPLAILFSGGAIGRCKLAAIETVGGGERVLFAGVGTGEDAAAAAGRGASVTLVDLSQKMLQRAADRCRRKGAGEIELIQEDVRDLDFPGRFDAVVVSFFLNVFPAGELPEILAHFARQLNPDGRILVGDFARPRGNLWGRSALELYHALPMAVFCLFTRNAWHSVHDIPSAAIKAGLRMVGGESHPLFGFGPRFFESLELRKERA